MFSYVHPYNSFSCLTTPKDHQSFGVRKSELESTLHWKEGEVEELEGSLAEVRSADGEKQAQLDGLQAELGSLKDSASGDSANFAEAQGKVAELESKLGELEQQLADAAVEHSSAVAELQEELNAAREEAKAATQAGGSDDSVAEQLRERLREKQALAKEKAAQSKEKLQTAKARIDELQQAEASHNETVAELSSELNAAQSKVAELESKLGELEQQLADAVAKADAAEACALGDAVASAATQDAKANIESELQSKMDTMHAAHAEEIAQLQAALIETEKTAAEAASNARTEADTQLQAAVAEAEQAAADKASADAPVGKGDDQGQVKKLRGLLMRANKHIEENKKLMATLKKEAEQSNATIAALSAQAEQSSARGLKALGVNPAACCVHTRAQVGQELWVFVLPHSASAVADGDWMRETHFGAAGGSLENLPQTITETADDEKHSALAKELQPYQLQVAQLESALATSKQELVTEVEEHALYKQRAHAVLKKKNDQIELLTSDEGSTQEVNTKLISAEAQVEDLEEKLVKITASLATTHEEKTQLEEQLKSGASAQAEVLELRSTCAALEEKCETLLEKEKVMLKEMQDAISAEEERSTEKSKALKKEHNEHRTRVFPALGVTPCYLRNIIICVLCAFRYQ